MILKKEIVTLVCIVVLFISGCTNNFFDNKKELVLISTSDSVVYFDETPEFAKDSEYVIELRFNNPIVRIDKKEAVNFTLDGSDPWYQKKLFLAQPIVLYKKDSLMQPSELNRLITLQYWDSSLIYEDTLNPGCFITAPILHETTITKTQNYCELGIPAGTLTDVYGNKNKAIHLLYQKKRN